MSMIKISTLFCAVTLFFSGCNSTQSSQQIATSDPQLEDAPIETEGDEYWARENLDLQRVGSLLERAESPEQFEALLNEENGINNLDLNGDGDVDYISIDEFGERDSNARGLSLFSRFGPNVIQEIATIFFYRDDMNSPGARILLTGNEQLYGDDHYYETNWMDRSLDLATSLFDDRDNRYRSPYDQDNYPAGYEPFEIVDPPAYRTRVIQLIPEPAFVEMTDSPVYLSRIKIKSPHKGKWMDKVHAKLAKPTREQVEFISADPGRTRFVGDERGGRRNEDALGDDRRSRKGNDLDHNDHRPRNDDVRSDDNPGFDGDRRRRGRDDRDRDDRGGGHKDGKGRGHDDDGGGKDKGGKGGGKKSN